MSHYAIPSCNGDLFESYIDGIAYASLKILHILVKF